MVCCWMLAPLHNYNRPTTQPPFSISTQPIATHNISISLPSCLFVSFLSICLFVFESERFLHPIDAIFLIVKCQFCPRLFLFNAALRFMNGCSDWGQLYKSARLQFGCRQGLRLIWDKFAITTHPPSIIWVKDQFAPNCILSIKMKEAYIVVSLSNCVTSVQYHLEAEHHKATVLLCLTTPQSGCVHRLVDFHQGQIGTKIGVFFTIFPLFVLQLRPGTGC